MKTVVIDPGHGGSQPGAVGPAKTKESMINLAVAKELAQLLTANGYKAILTRAEDKDVAPGESLSKELSARCRIANTNRADAFISIHCNALDAVAKGIETWYHNFKSPAGKNLIVANKNYAMLLYDELLKAFPGHVKRGVQPDTARYPKSGFGVLRKLEVPGALVELEFLSHPEMEKLLKDPKNQKAYAQALFVATKQFLEG